MHIVTGSYALGSAHARLRVSPIKCQSRLQQTTFIIIFFIVFLKKIRFDVSSESSARQRIHMENQALFSSKDKSKKLKCRLLQFFCLAR